MDKFLNICTKCGSGDVSLILKNNKSKDVKDAFIAFFCNDCSTEEYLNVEEDFMYDGQTLKKVFDEQPLIDDADKVYDLLDELLEEESSEDIIEDEE